MTTNRFKGKTYDDPDETDGRKLYRDLADKLVSMEENMARRKVKLGEIDKLIEEAKRRK